MNRISFVHLQHSQAWVLHQNMPSNCRPNTENPGCREGKAGPPACVSMPPALQCSECHCQNCCTTLILLSTDPWPLVSKLNLLSRFPSFLLLLALSLLLSRRHWWDQPLLEISHHFGHHPTFTWLKIACLPPPSLLSKMWCLCFLFFKNVILLISICLWFFCDSTTVSQATYGGQRTRFWGLTLLLPLFWVLHSCHQAYSARASTHSSILQLSFPFKSSLSPCTETMGLLLISPYFSHFSPVIFGAPTSSQPYVAIAVSPRSLVILYFHCTHSPSNAAGPLEAWKNG